MTAKVRPGDVVRDHTPSAPSQQSRDGLATAEQRLSMRITVRDRASESAWGSGPTNPRTRTVTISAFCPTCGARRGQPRGLNTCDDGTFYWVQVWDNPCGHVDHYVDVIREADERAEQIAASASPMDDRR